MSKRHRDAYYIQNPGACNPSGIAHSIVKACQEIRDNPLHQGTCEIRNDPAIRLMVHQLAYLCNVAEFDQEMTAYSAAMDYCEAQDAN